MKNSVELLEEKTNLKNEANAMINKAKEEIRALTDAEKERFEALKQQIMSINDDLLELSDEFETPVETEKPTERQINKENKTNHINMTEKTNFSLLRAIRNVAENKMQDSISEAVINAGAAEMRAAGLNYVGNIQLPVSEEYRTVTVATEHDDVIATDMMNVLEPLHSNNVLNKFKMLTGLKGDVQYPVLSTVNAYWSDETADVSTSTPTFSNVKLQPKRLSVVVPISKQFLVQDSVSAETAIRNEIVAAVEDKLLTTIFGDEAGTTNKPQGLFYSNSSIGDCSTYKGICTMEADIECANMNNYSFVASPRALAKIKELGKGGNHAASVYDDGKIDGIGVETTTAIDGTKFICGDFSQMVLAQFGNLDITVDNVTLAAQGCIRLIVNSFWDFKVLRSGCYAVRNMSN